MCDINIEVVELCETILLFQKYINNLKQSLFHFSEVTDILIWNHLIGADYQIVTYDMIAKLCFKHQIKSSQKSKKLLFSEYSQKKQMNLTKNQFLSIFLDYKQKFILQILKTRNFKKSFAKNHQPDFRITQILIKILQQTLKFLVLKEQMKNNIFLRKKYSKCFQLLKADQQHFLIFVNPYRPNWGLSEVKIILEHIFKTKKWDLKQFYYFFVPYSCKSKSYNPNQNILSNQNVSELKQTYSSIISHKKASNFGKKSVNLKKTLYLK